MFYGTYIGNDRMLIKTAWGMRLIASAKDMSLMPTLLVDGAIESGLTNWLINNQESFKGKNIIDVGANIGYFTVLFGCIVGQEGRVIAYEANPSVFKLLEENIYLGQLQGRTALINRAVVGDDREYIEFYASEVYQGNSSTIPHTKEYKEQFATDSIVSFRVPCETLNRYTDEKIALVKIDVEGAELDVLEGMGDLLASDKVQYIVFELNKNMAGDKFEELKNRLISYRARYGALFYLFSPQGETRHVTLDEIFAHDYIDNILIKF